MSLKLLVDEDSQDKILVAKLRHSGHDILTVREAGLMGQPDRVVLERAVAESRVVLTHNCADFCTEPQTLRNAGGHRHGVILLYEQNDPAKDMSYNDIVTAIANIDKAVAAGELVLADREISLSYYRY